MRGSLRERSHSPLWSVSDATMLRRRAHVLVQGMVLTMTARAIDCAVINKSTVVPDSDLLVWTIACVKQVQEHAAPLWKWPTPQAQWLPDARFIKDGMDVLYLFDDSDSPGALGWHDVDDQGRPFGKVFAKTTMANGSSVSSCLSHELLELCGDPDVNEWVTAPDGFQYAQELCDQVEADMYTLDGVEVSNFLLPAAFADAKADRYDYLGKLAAPFTLSPGGYAIRRNPKTGETGQIFAEHRESWRAATKAHPAARTAKRLLQELASPKS